MADDGRGEPTDKQRRVHDFMLKSQRERGFPPSIRDIAGEFGFSGANAVLCHLKALVKKGWATKSDRFISRGYVAIDVDAERAGRCPTCGRPNENHVRGADA